MRVMDVDALIITMSPILSEDVIRIIVSYLVMKIPKNDPRYQQLNAHNKVSLEHRVQERYWETYDLASNGDRFRGFFITFSNEKYAFIIDFYRNDYISYRFQNMVTNEYNDDRCWYKLEDMSWRKDSTNYWQQFCIDGWIPNPNSATVGDLRPGANTHLV